MEIIFRDQKIIKRSKLTLEDAVLQLNNIQEVTFDPGASKENYFDIIVSLFRELRMEGKSQSLSKALKEVFDDKNNEEKIRDLGVNMLDLYIMGNNAPAVKAITDNLGVKNNYSLAKYFRFYDIAKCIHEEENVEFNVDKITINLNGMNVPLKLVPYMDTQSINIDTVTIDPITGNTKIQEVKTLAVMIQNYGGLVWNYHQTAYEDKITDVFDKVVRYGDGSSPISVDHIPTLLAEQLNVDNLDFAMIRIAMHDLQGDAAALKGIIDKLPDNLAKQTLYIFDTCHSGQYHKLWNELGKSSILITTSQDWQITSVLDFKVEKFLNIVAQNKDLNIESFIEFYSGFNLSCPEISGKYSDKYASAVKAEVSRVNFKIKEDRETSSLTEEKVQENAKRIALQKKWLADLIAKDRQKIKDVKDDREAATKVENEKISAAKDNSNEGTEPLETAFPEDNIATILPYVDTSNLVISGEVIEH